MSLNPQLNLIIDRDYEVFAKTEDGYQNQFRLALDKEQPHSHLHRIIREVNDKLLGIVQHPTTGGKYSDNLDIPDNICNKDLKEIAELDLFDRIFIGDAPTEQALDFKENITKALQKPAKIEITTIGNHNFFFPWSLIYDGKLKPNEDVDRHSFWGFKHIIEQIPLPPNRRLPSGLTIDSSNSLKLSFNYNKRIDTEYKGRGVEEQMHFFNRINHPNFIRPITTRNSEDKLLEEFGKDVDESIVYFYCHAKSGIDINSLDSDTFLSLSEPGKELTLHKLKTFTKNGNFIKAPLVFMNACESAQMSPLFYDSFITYFMSKGSRGVLGSLSKVPAIFASKFAIQFIERFMMKERVGQILVDLRKDYLDKHNNLLGLYYVAYCSANIRMDSPILMPIRKTRGGAPFP